MITFLLTQWRHVTCWLFSTVYRRWLWNDYHETYDRVLRVRGWRTALVTSVLRSGKESQRRQVTPCFWWFQ